MKVDQGRAAAASVRGFVDECDWHALFGKRISFVKAHLMDPCHDMHLTSMELIVVAEEQLTILQFDSKRHVAEDEGKPYIIRQSYLPTNAGVALGQFHASLLSGKHLSVQLLCRNRGLSTAEELCKHDREAAHVVRKACFSSSVMAEIRHVRTLTKCWPLKGALLVNSDVPDDMKLAMVRELRSSCPQCLDQGVFRVIKRIVVHLDDLLRDSWQEALSVLFYLIDGNTSEQELHHAFNKLSNTQLSKFELLVARFVNREAVRLAMPTVIAPSCPVPEPMQAQPTRAVHNGQLTP